MYILSVGHPLTINELVGLYFQTLDLSNGLSVCFYFYM
jgi:hypothetical protein